MEYLLNTQQLVAGDSSHGYLLMLILFQQGYLPHNHHIQKGGGRPLLVDNIIDEKYSLLCNLHHF